MRDSILAGIVGCALKLEDIWFMPRGLLKTKEGFCLTTEGPFFDTVEDLLYHTSPVGDLLGTIQQIIILKYIAFGVLITPKAIEISLRSVFPEIKGEADLMKKLLLTLWTEGEVTLHFTFVEVAKPKQK